MTRSNGRLGRLLEAFWIALLILPAATTLPPTIYWEYDDFVLLLAPAWLALAARALFARRSFFAATLPIVLTGVLCLGTAALRGADLLELLLQWRTYSRQEVESAAQPYAVAAIVACALIAGLCAAAWRWAPTRSTTRRTRAAVVIATLAAAFAVPLADWLRVWPVKPLLVVAAAPGDSRWIADRLFPKVSTANPRSPTANWNASRVPGAPASETVVLIIGETLRNDFLRECHGPDRVRPVAAGALVACDVTAGSDLTVTSVPLLVSREMPGHAMRVSSDATFAHALQEAGFDTYWYGTQGAAIAWSDAEHQRFALSTGRDSLLLMPPLLAALAEPAPLKAIVLHAYNAHDPYCDRFDHDRAPYPVDCAHIGAPWDKANLAQVRAAYADAVDTSIGFVNEVIAQLQQRREPAFLVYTPDHGEALLDDGREIWSHALRHPTRWDTHVPAVFWANDAWRSTHAAQWARLSSQIGAPLMHVDIVPTLLDAAGVRYDERRQLPVDLLARGVPPRRRVIQVAPGRTIPWDTLVDEARAAGPLQAGR